MTPEWTQRASGRLRHVDDARSDFEIDYARVIHSGAFRRLQGKTQILSLGDDDFYRSRLTHSMEVAQIAEGIVQQLRVRKLPDEMPEQLPPAALIQAIGLAHDIGHPPFGHGGELALNYCMRGHGGFEGNAQTLRLLSRLEAFSPMHGADLTRRCLLGLLKYPVLASRAQNKSVKPRLSSDATAIAVLDLKSCKPVKACYDEDRQIFDWVCEPLSDADRKRFTKVRSRAKKHGEAQAKSFDCSIMDMADDIAYGVHDLEDAIALGFIARDDFCAAIPEKAWKNFLDMLAARPLNGDGLGDYDELLSYLFGGAVMRKSAIGRLVHYFIRSATIEDNANFSEPLLRWTIGLSPEAKGLLDELKALIVQFVINSPRVQHLEFKGQRMVVSVFEAIASDPSRLLPVELAALHACSEAPMRVICDYIANFTDGALLKTYDRLFSPRNGTVFDRI